MSGTSASASAEERGILGGGGGGSLPQLLQRRRRLPLPPAVPVLPSVDDPPIRGRRDGGDAPRGRRAASPPRPGAGRMAACVPPPGRRPSPHPPLPRSPPSSPAGLRGVRSCSTRSLRLVRPPPSSSPVSPPLSLQTPPLYGTSPSSPPPRRSPRGAPRLGGTARKPAGHPVERAARYPPSLVGSGSCRRRGAVEGGRRGGGIS